MCVLHVYICVWCVFLQKDSERGTKEKKNLKTEKTKKQR